MDVLVILEKLADMKRRSLGFAMGVLVALAATGSAHGDVALLIEEPYGFFGSINPTGHSAIYLNHVCAESSTSLRRCEPGETGVVISRYSGIRNFDWVAIPLLPYLYAVERAEDVPEWAEQPAIAAMREEYAEAHLGALASDASEADSESVWPQLLGVAYIRKIYSFEVVTTREQDDRLIADFNGRENRSHFNLFTNNCADFSRALLNFYYPGAVHRSITADAAITTPKQIAKTLVTYAHRHDQLELREFVIPQVPGSIPRSHKPRGVVEALLKTKKYLVPIAVFHPYVLAGIAATYLTRGRFDLAKHAPVIPVTDQAKAFVGGTPGIDGHRDHAPLISVGDEVLLGQLEFPVRIFVPAFGVFAEDVDLNVERGAGSQGVETGGRVGVGDDGYLNFLADDGGDGEANAFNRD